MKRLFAMGLILIALASFAALAERDSGSDLGAEATREPLFDGVFDEGGYDGEWRQLPALGVEFFLPEGWSGGGEDELYEGVFAFDGESGDGTVRVLVTLFDTNDGGKGQRDYHGQTGEDFLAYVQAVFEDGGSCVLTEANGREAVLYRDDEHDPVYVRVLLPDHGERVICFMFNCATPEAISDEFALAIAGTTTDWAEWF